MYTDNFEKHSNQFLTSIKRESTQKNQNITLLDELKVQTTIKKQNLTPEIKKREVNSPFSEDRSRYTEKKLSGFESQMKTLGLIEARKYNDNHSKKIINFDNLKFSTDREKTKLTNFYQKEKDNDEDLIEISPNSKNDFYFEISNFGFLYFFINVRGQPIPFRLNILRKEEHSKNTYIKLYLSTKNKHPNRFNNDLEIENYSLNFYSFSEGAKFKEENVYFAVFSETRAEFKVRVSFGRAKSVNCTSRFLNYMKETEIMKKKMLQRINKNDLKPVGENLKNLRSDIIEAQIRLIMEKKKKKMEELTKGKNCITDNIDRLKYFIPREIHMLRQAKRESKTFHLVEVQRKKAEYENEKRSRAIFSANRSDIARKIKQTQQEYNTHLSRYTLLNNTWRILFKSSSLFKFLRILLKVIRKHRIRSAYNKSLRIKYIKLFYKKLQKIAPSPLHRIVLDTHQSLSMLFNNKMECLNKNSEKIVGDLMKIIVSSLFIKFRFEKMNEQIIRIQKKWRVNRRKKLDFKEKIQKIWIENIFKIYMDLLEEKKKSENSYYITSVESIRKSSLALKKTAQFIENIDFHTQAIEIRGFLEENIKRWRKAMSEYRTNQMMIRLDPSKKRQVSILKRMIMKNSNKNSIFENMDFTYKEKAFDAPLLYKLPSNEELKEMIRKYLEKKKIL